MRRGRAGSARTLAIAAMAGVLLSAVRYSSAVAVPTDPRPGPAAVADAAEVNVSGLWDFGNGLIVGLGQSEASVTSAVVKFECSGADWQTFIAGTIEGETLKGTMQRCTPDTSVLVSDCGLAQLWDTEFEAEISRHEIVGTYRGEFITYDTVDGHATNCKLDHETENDFTGRRLDCRPLTFEELAKEHPDYAHEVSLAKEFEGGKTLHWTEEQQSNGFKGRAETFAKDMARSRVYAPGTINSAYRPYLYQAHFANLRECGLTLIQALQDHGHDAELVEAIGESVDALTAEVTKHGLKTEDTTVAGKTVRVPFVCWRDPISGCPHVDGKAIDVSFNQADGLDWIGALHGWCRRYIEKDKPHWEEATEGKCGQEYMPGRADINLYVESPVSVMLTDASGRRIGYDVEGQAVVNDIGAGAYYSGPDAEPQHLFVPAGVRAGEAVEVVLTPMGDGPYKVRLAFGNEDGVEPQETVMTGTARVGQSIEPIRLTFEPGAESVEFPEATETTADAGSAQTFDAGANGGRISLSSPIAQKVLINPQLKAVGMRLTEGASGEVTVRVPFATLGEPVGARVDGIPVASSVEIAGGVASVRFTLPTGAKVVEIGALGAETVAAGGEFPVWLIVVVAGTVTAGLLAYWRRRQSRRQRQAPPAS